MDKHFKQPVIDLGRSTVGDSDAEHDERGNFGDAHMCSESPFSRDDKINAKLCTGEQVFGTVVDFGCDEVCGEYVDMYKPAVIGTVNTAKGPASAFIPWRGDSARLYYSAIVAHSPAIPDNLLPAYIQYSTGIEVAPKSKIQTQ